MIDVVKIEIIFYAKAREYETQFYLEHILSIKTQIFVQKEGMLYYYAVTIFDFFF